MSKQPSLKSASGAGFTYEDKAAAVFLCEMLTGVRSLGSKFGIIEKLERQAGDWEPFGDILLQVPNGDGKLIQCGASVKSNRQINSNGCDESFCAGIWEVMAKGVFANADDFLMLVSVPLAVEVSRHLSELCQQARANDAERFDQKVVHKNVRKIYDSFRNPKNNDPAGLPGHALAKFIHREFDFEATISQSEVAALKLCREALLPEGQSENKAKELWEKLCKIAEELRISGGGLNREDLTTKLRLQFPLKDDPSDAAEWTRIRNFSRDGIEEIETSLVSGIKMPRSTERQALQNAIATLAGCSVIGDSGSGKSALIKSWAVELEKQGVEIVWIRADRFNQLNAAVSRLDEVLARSRRTSGLLVLDAAEGCGTLESLSTIGRLIAILSAKHKPMWSFVISCQTPDWARVSTGLSKHLAGHSVLKERVDCGLLSDDDFELVCAASPSVKKLAQEPRLRRFLSTPKMLDVLLSGQLAESRSIAGEADLVEWWWEQQVRGSKLIAAEERVARELANRMADELCSELPPDSVAGAENAANELIRNRVLRRTRDGLLRFEHDLLADWARVMHLKGLGEKAFEFIKSHTENPPWLRAVRLLSQHLLDRTADLARWREILNICKAPARPRNDPSAENLQVIDAWIEGIIFSLDPARVLTQVSAELFESDGWLLRRLLRRLMLVGTFPDPVIQDRFIKLDPETAEFAATRYRLPMWGIWSPVIEFLNSHPQAATDLSPVEIGEIAEMWSRMDSYLSLNWASLANLAVLNAEKELRREIAGEYRRDSGPRSLGGGNNSRITIYSGALYAALQSPERVVKLLAKAAGIAPWDEADLPQQIGERWLGDWDDSRSAYDSGAYVEMPVTSWPEGPSRQTSRDFFHAWFHNQASLPVFNRSPQIACDATLGFLIDWPKRIIRQGHHPGAGIDHFGFTFEADHMYPPFYTKGPFLNFLRANWEVGLNLIIRLTNFATERYADWWPYDPKPSVLTFSTEGASVPLLGNHQVYSWFRYNMNTAQVVTCALMALEKWLEEQIQKGESITTAIRLIWKESRSLALAGLLVALGKRHRQLFLSDLKPLLFARELFMQDTHSVSESLGSGYWPRDGQVINRLRREWESMPGRKTSLLDFAQEWFVLYPEFQTVLKEVSTHWRKLANEIPSDSEDRLPLLRWASNFDLANWTEVTTPEGRTGWRFEQPAELRDLEGAQALSRHQALLRLPFQCSEMLEKRAVLTSQQLEAIWAQLNDWGPFEDYVAKADDPDNFESSLLDHRHARAGMLAVILSLGSNWLDTQPARRSWIEAELYKIFVDPPPIKIYSPDEMHDDYEAFLARGVVQCWVRSVDNKKWRDAVASLVTAYRYQTVQRLFQEAFLEREKIQTGFHQLEAFALAFAAIRRQATLESLKRQPEIVENWRKKWIPKFAKGSGPKWTNDWAKIEVKEAFPPAFKTSHGGGHNEVGRRDYGFEMGVLLAAFGSLPSLHEARNANERNHWMAICSELLAAYIRTLPHEITTEDEEWRIEEWKADERILEIVAARLFQCTDQEQHGLWTPILNLPPAAHHHITQFLNDVLMQTIQAQPSNVSALLPLWRAMTEHLLALPKWSETKGREQDDVWKHLFLYGATVTTGRDADHAPLVQGMRDLFERHIKAMNADPYDQSALAAFLVSAAGEQLLVDALEWLSPIWQDTQPYFWKRTVERGNFEDLLQRAWQKHFVIIRQRPGALKAFKLLTLNLAAQQVSTAIEIQRQIGNA